MPPWHSQLKEVHTTNHVEIFPLYGTSPWFWSHIKQIINTLGQAKLKTLSCYCNVFLRPKKYFRFDLIKHSHINLLEHEPFHASSLLLKINTITLVSFPLSYMGNWNIAAVSAALILIHCEVSIQTVLSSVLSLKKRYTNTFPIHNMQFSEIWKLLSMRAGYSFQPSSGVSKPLYFCSTQSWAAFSCSH